MLISYEPNSDVLSIAVSGAPVAQTQVQGTAVVSFDAQGQAVSVAIAEASSLLWEHGGQVQILLPAVPTTTTVVETTRVTKRPAL